MDAFGRSKKELHSAQNEKSKLKIYNGRIIAPYRIIPERTIVVGGGKITEVDRVLLTDTIRMMTLLQQI